MAKKNGGVVAKQPPVVDKMKKKAKKLNKPKGKK